MTTITIVITEVHVSTVLALVASMTISGRASWTKMEKIAYLEGYLEDLQNKMKSVEERIAGLKEEE